MSDIDNSATDNTTTDGSETGKEKKFRFFTFISCISVMLIPLLIIVTVLLFFLTSSGFYASILRNSDLITTFIQAKKWNTSEKIRTEIEEKTGLESFKNEYSHIKKTYDDNLEAFNTLNRTREYDRLVQQRDELSDLSWNKAPSVFKDKSEFKKYKDEELSKFDERIGAIKAYRKESKKEISAAEDELDDAEDAFTDARKELQKKEDMAGEISLSHENSLMGQIYADLAVISPALTKELNEKLINRAVRQSIDNVLAFFTGYYEQVKEGNVYRNAFAISMHGLRDNLRVRVPGFSISLWVEEKSRGILQKRHLFSEVFVDKILTIPDLKKRDTFINLFKFFDSGLGESFGTSYLKKINLSINDGIIQMEPMEFSGSDAEVIETAMLCATWGNYIKFVLPVIIFILLLFILLSGTEKRKKLVNLKRILLYPSILLVILGLAWIVVSFNILNIFPDLSPDPMLKMYVDKFVPVVSIHLAGPMVIVFTLLALIGIVAGKKAGALQE